MSQSLTRIGILFVTPNCCGISMIIVNKIHLRGCLESSVSLIKNICIWRNMLDRVTDALAKMLCQCRGLAAIYTTLLQNTNKVNVTDNVIM